MILTDSFGLELGNSHYESAQLNAELHARDADEIGTAENGPEANEFVQNFVQSDAPLLWSDHYNGKKIGPSNKVSNKKTEEGLLNDVPDDGMPNTVGPNPNIFGGFPANDNWGGFQLPSPEKLAVLKLALSPHRGHMLDVNHVESGTQNWNYDYEHHALPEYDVKETPPFHLALLQGMKMMEEAKNPKAGSKPCVGLCPPATHLVDLSPQQCEMLYSWCKPKKQPAESQYELPCPYKILEKLYGCKPPAKAEKEGDQHPVEKPEELFSEKPEEPEIPPQKPMKAKKVPSEKAENNERKPPPPTLPMKVQGNIKAPVQGDAKSPSVEDQVGQNILQKGQALPEHGDSEKEHSEPQKQVEHEEGEKEHAQAQKQVEYQVSKEEGEHKLTQGSTATPANTSAQARLQQQLDLLSIIQQKTGLEGNTGHTTSQQAASNRNEDTMPGNDEQVVDIHELSKVLPFINGDVNELGIIRQAKANSKLKVRNPKTLVGMQRSGQNSGQKSNLSKVTGQALGDKVSTQSLKKIKSINSGGKSLNIGDTASIMAQVGSELEQDLNKKLAKLGDTQTVFTLGNTGGSKKSRLKSGGKRHDLKTYLNTLNGKERSLKGNASHSKVKYENMHAKDQVFLEKVFKHTKREKFSKRSSKIMPVIKYKKGQSYRC